MCGTCCGEILASFQHGHAHEITTAQSVADALGILERDDFDPILMDMVMPGIGDPMLRRQGIDLLQRIRELGVNAPVLMMSGDYESRTESDALSEGAFADLRKPFNLRELDRLVARAIASASGDCSHDPSTTGDRPHTSDWPENVTDTLSSA